MNIRIETISKLEELFKKKNWEIINDSASFSSTFNRFCSRLSLFDEEKQDLLIALSYRFWNVGINDFQNYFCIAVNKIPELKNYSSILIAPLKKPSITSPKSSDMIWYYLKSYSDFTYEDFGKKLFFTADWKQVSELLLNNSHLLVLVDDFIGTGETAIETIEELKLLKVLSEKSDFKIISFLAQEVGLKNIFDKYGNITACCEVLKKGISDFYVGKDLERNLHLMLEMEKAIKVKADYKLGYGNSESLVAFSQRSANNTFPVFWLEKTNKLAPFKR